MNFDFRETLREQAEKCQDENRARLLADEALDGAALAPDEEQRSLRPDEQPGVATGALLEDLTRRENVRVDATGFQIVPSADQVVKWTVYNAGRTRHGVQPPRPVSGISTERHSEIAEAVARDARDQLVRFLNRRSAP
jgi:hypothetical protein